ncbi:MAG: dipeptidase [Anaerolineaceae bacterium]
MQNSSNISSTSIKYFEDHFDNYMETYLDLLRIPSVSTDPACTKDMTTTITFLANLLEEMGAETVQIFPTEMHPILFAEKRAFIPNAQTLLVYGHYDVQPPNPLDEWSTPPFEPAIRGENLFARGASDMKGQIMAGLIALDSVLKTSQLPLNIKFLFEGEEEIGSPSLDSFIESHQELLKCDMVLNPDAGMIGPNSPTIVYGLRGLLYFEVRIDGPKADLHSGLFGGNVANPAIVLSEIIAKLHNPDGSVAIPGFYDRVLPLTPEEKAKIASVPNPDENYLKITGVPQLYGEKGYTLLERAGARPTLDVNGFYSGFIGEGSKTIIPAYAKAKISCRLVPNQEPDDIYALTEEYIRSLVSKSVRATIFKHSGAPAYLADNAPGADNLRQALMETWNTPVSFKREGGSIPVATTMQRFLGVKSLLTGFGLPDDNIHSPNEHQHLPTWKKGIQALIRFYLSFSQ